MTENNVTMFSRRISYLGAIACFVFLSLAAGAQTPRKNQSKKKTPVNSTRVLKTASGLIFAVTKKGTGQKPKVGDTIIAHYTGTLSDGTKFDSSRDRDKPYTFTFGKGRVIKGWDEAFAKLRVGDNAILIIPPSLGYGAKGYGKIIPPDSTLIFIVELVGIDPPKSTAKPAASEE